MRDSGRARRALNVALIAVALAGCAGIPDSGSVRVADPIPIGGGLGNEVNVRVLPPPPQPGMSPSDVVKGFLHAVVNRDDDYKIARNYLTPRAAVAWDTDGLAMTYDAGGVELRRRTADGSTTVAFTAPRIGSIDGRGEFAPLRGAVRTSFGLVKDNGEWRIDRLRDGVLLSSSDASRAYRFANVYYANRSGAALVPEQVLLPPEPRGVATALVRALLSGPGAWLAPAVHTAFPAGTHLLGNVPVNQGVAEVNLSPALRSASATDLRTLSAQLVWTLRQVPDISGVRLLADSSPVTVPGAGAVQGRDQWSAVDPTARPRVPGAFHRQGSAWVAVGREPIPALGRLDGLREVAMSRLGDRIAALRPTSSGTSLLVGRAGDVPVRRLTGRTMTPPTFGADGSVFTLVTDRTGRWVARVDETGDVQHVPVGSALAAEVVQDLQISRDGARVAAVVGARGHGRLLVGRMSMRDGSLLMDGFRAVLRGVTDVRGLAWGGPGQVLVTAAVAGGGREVVSADVNGYLTVSIGGLLADPIDVAAAPGRPLVITAGSSIWVNEPSGGWARLRRGDQPRYAG